MGRINLSPEELALLDKIEKILKNKAPETNDAVLTTEQLMSYLSSSRRNCQKWRDEGLIEYSAVNGKFYYRLSAINNMLDKHLVKTVD